MIHAELTGDARAAMTSIAKDEGAAVRHRKRLLPLLLLSAATIGGCVTVNAPEEPIVIELNINIKQEVIYRLAEDAGNTIEENADIF